MRSTVDNAGTAVRSMLRRTFRGSVEAGHDADGAGGPVLVAHAVTVSDLATAVRAAAGTGIPLAVRGGGHGQLRPPAGRLVLDTGHLGDVQIFPHRRVASVGPGARWCTVMQAAAPYGLAPLCGNSLDVGVAGYTLGGGVGWLSREYGYAADNVVAIDAILADGTSVRATDDSEPELFWGLRGGGANLALATRIEVRLAPVTRVVAGEIHYSWDAAADVLTAFARQAPPDHLTTMVVLDRKDRAAPPTVAVQVMSTADPDQARQALDAVLPHAAGRASRDTVAPVPYREAATLGGTFPAGFELLDRLDSAAIGVLLHAVDTGTDDHPVRLEIRYWGGVPSRPDAHNGPVGHRHVPYSITVDGPPQLCTGIAALGTGGSFRNFLRDTDRTASAYTGPDWARLRRLKAMVDPQNLFGFPHNIPPAGTGG